jgi:hypothetical protein
MPSEKKSTHHRKAQNELLIMYRRPKGFKEHGGGNESLDLQANTTQAIRTMN